MRRIAARARGLRWGMASSGHVMRVYERGGEALPEEAAELFGDEVREAFEGGVERPVVVAAEDGDGGWLAGVYLVIEPTADGVGDPVASIRQLVVKPAFRGRGLAGWLLRRAQHVASEAGCGRVRSTAGWGCPDHLSMYDRLGYQRLRGESPYLVSLSL